MDKLTALRVFRRVADSGSFIAAANELSLSAAAISKNIRELEAELGIRLINRTTRRMYLTDAGSNYLASIRTVLELLDTADDAVTAGRGEPIGQLRIAAPMSIGIARIAPAIAAFLPLYPRVRVDLQLDDRQVDVIGGGFDVAIRGASSLRDSSLVARKISGMRRVICAAPSYLERRGIPNSPTALAEHACLA